MPSLVVLVLILGAPVSASSFLHLSNAVAASPPVGGRLETRSRSCASKSCAQVWDAPLCHAAGVFSPVLIRSDTLSSWWPRRTHTPTTEKAWCDVLACVAEQRPQLARPHQNTTLGVIAYSLNSSRYCGQGADTPERAGRVF